MNTLTGEHFELLGLAGRGRPDIYLSAEEVLGAPHAAAMRLAFETLGLAGFLCVEGTPTIAFQVQTSEDPYQLHKVHKALWNQGLASLLLVIRRQEIQAYSLMRKPVKEDWRPDGGEPDPRLVETLKLTARGLEAFDLVTAVESGRFFAEHPKSFDRDSRVDRVLLANLIETRERLVREGLERKGLETKLARTQAQALLLQVMFIAYLEDRGFLGEETFKEATGGKAPSQTELFKCGDPSFLHRLFAALREDFNGDIFLAPCAFDGSQAEGGLLAEDLEHLAEFRGGLVEMDTGQGRFWPYDFRYVPVELISAVYDRFLGEDPERRRASGAYYTPRALADLAMDQTWELLAPETVRCDDFRLLDPACGSGIFLVRAFQRMAEELRRESGERHLPWDSLLDLVHRVHGWDLEADAVRIAVFSLYVALLEEADPDAVRERLQQGRLLPPLFGCTLRDRNFFAEESAEPHFDVILGNPPWVSRRPEATVSAERWRKAHNDIAKAEPNGDEIPPFPEGELAWGFAWKALRLIEPGGLVGFLLPAMGFLLNQKSATIEARRLWLREARVLRIINLSDLRFQLFDGAIRPTVLCLFRRFEDRVDNYSFEYWCPKVDRHLPTTGILTVPSEDRSRLHLASVLDEPATWKHRMWMRSPEAKLLQWLGTFPRLGDKLTRYRGAKRAGKPWIIGQGFQPATKREQEDPDYKPKNCMFDPKLPHLESKDFQKWVLPRFQRKPFGPTPLRRCGFELGFKGPHVLVLQGTEGATGRLQAAYVEESLTCRHSLQAIHFPHDDAGSMKLLTAVFNSGFAAWYFFHEAANPGAERPKIHEEELLQLPFVPLQGIDDAPEQQQAAKEIVEVMDLLLRDRNEPFLEAKLMEIEGRLDRLVCLYYGLSEDDVVVVQDGLQTIIPSVQPRRDTEPPLWRPSREEDWERYSYTLSRALGGWFADEIVFGELIGRNQDLAVLKLSFRSSVPGESFVIRSADEQLHEILRRLRGALPREQSKNLYLLPNLRIFLDDDLYLVKPRAIRFWLRSTALVDADAIAAHLFETGQAPREGLGA